MCNSPRTIATVTHPGFLVSALLPTPSLTCTLPETLSGILFHRDKVSGNIGQVSLELTILLPA